MDWNTLLIITAQHGYGIQSKVTPVKNRTARFVYKDPLLRVSIYVTELNEGYDMKKTTAKESTKNTAKKAQKASVKKSIKTKAPAKREKSTIPTISNGFTEARIKIVNMDPIDECEITHPQDLVTYMQRLFGDVAEEYFVVVYLNSQNRPMNYSIIAKGGWASALIDLKVIFSTALLNHSEKMMLFHNHPGGSLTPSKRDITFTKTIIKVADMMDMLIVDHIILGKDDYFSFREYKIMEFNDGKPNNDAKQQRMI